MNTLIARSSNQTKYLIIRHWPILSPVICKQKSYHLTSSTISCKKYPIFSPEISPLFSLKERYTLQTCRYFSKKKKSSKVQEEIEESDDEDFEETPESDEIIDDYNLILKTVPSLRLDSVLKAGLGISKKKVEKDFYGGKLRINGEAVLKKAASVQIDDELDLIKGSHPDNVKMIIVDRIIIKSIGKVNDNGNFPLKMQVFKSLTIENYSDPWVKSSLADNV